MRHLVGFVLGVILAPVLLYGLGFGTALAASSWSGLSGLLGTSGLAAAGVLAVVGVTIAVLTRALPPLAALAAGLVLVAVNAWAVLYPPLVEVVLRPAGSVDPLRAGVTELLSQGVVAVIGVILVVSAMAPRRWRGESTQADEDYISYIAADVGPGGDTDPPAPSATTAWEPTAGAPAGRHAAVPTGEGPGPPQPDQGGGPLGDTRTRTMTQISQIGGS